MVGAAQPADLKVPPTARAGAGQVWIIEPRGSGLRARALELRQYRGLIGFFAGDFLRSVYRRTFIGWSWLFIRPLVNVSISTFVFHGLVGIQTVEVPYFLFFLVGTSIWQLFTQTAIFSMRSLHHGRKLLTKLYFPRIILPIGATCPPLVEFAIHVALIVGASLYFLVAEGRLYLTLGLYTLLAPGGVAIALLMGLAIGLIAAVIGGEKKDLRFAIRSLFTSWYFLTPVLWPLSLVGEHSSWFAINPMTTAVELFRQGVFGIKGGLDALTAITTIAILSLALSFSVLVFLREEAAAVDRI